MLAEPWLRGPLPDVHPLLAPILYTFQQAREDLARHTESLTTEQLWATPLGPGSVGFHVRHIAGSTARLMEYLQGRQLTAEQLAEAGTESEPLGLNRDDLLALLDRAFRDAESVVQALDPQTLAEARFVGRLR